MDEPTVELLSMTLSSGELGRSVVPEVMYMGESAAEFDSIYRHLGWGSDGAVADPDELAVPVAPLTSTAHMIHSLESSIDADTDTLLAYLHGRPTASKGFPAPIGVDVLSSVNVADESLADKLPRAISKPAFSPSGARYVVGTEIVSQPRKNQIVFGQVDTETWEIKDHFVGLSMTDAVSDVCWRDETHILAAAGTHIALIIVADWDSFMYKKVVVSQESHTGAIRQMALSPFDGKTVLSGCEGGKLVTTDIERYCADGPSAGEQTVRRISVNEAISSVSWRAEGGGGLVLATTEEGGHLYGFDLRAPTLGRPVVAYKSGSGGGLYAHVDVGDDVVFLGFEGGRMEMLDLRMTERASALHTEVTDPGLHVVGDFALSPSGSKLATLGQFGATVWEYGTGHLLVRGTLEPEAGAGGKVSGTFVNDDVLALSDSSGTLALYDVNWGMSYDELVSM